MTDTHYFDERANALEAAGRDPDDDDDWAQPDNEVDESVEERAAFLAFLEDIWGDLTDDDWDDYWGDY